MTWPELCENFDVKYANALTWDALVDDQIGGGPSGKTETKRYQQQVYGSTSEQCLEFMRKSLICDPSKVKAAVTAVVIFEHHDGRARLCFLSKRHTASQLYFHPWFAAVPLPCSNAEIRVSMMILGGKTGFGQPGEAEAGTPARSRR